MGRGRGASVQQQTPCRGTGSHRPPGLIPLGAHTDGSLGSSHMWLPAPQIPRPHGPAFPTPTQDQPRSRLLRDPPAPFRQVYAQKATPEANSGTEVKDYTQQRPRLHPCPCLLGAPLDLSSGSRGSAQRGGTQPDAGGWRTRRPPRTGSALQQHSPEHSRDPRPPSASVSLSGHVRGH